MPLKWSLDDVGYDTCEEGVRRELDDVGYDTVQKALGENLRVRAQAEVCGRSGELDGGGLVHIWRAVGVNGEVVLSGAGVKGEVVVREDGGPFSLKLVEDDVYICYMGFGSGVLEMYGADVKFFFNFFKVFVLRPLI